MAVDEGAPAEVGTPVPVSTPGLEGAVGGDDLAVSTARPVHPYVHVVVMGVLGAVAVLAWLIVFELGNRLLWENQVITANPWLFPAICLPFSLLVGILVKRFHAPTTLDESMLDTFGGDVSKIDWRGLPVNVVMAWASLFSGAVLGPEGAIGGIASKLAALYADKVRIPVEHRQQLVFSTLASGYNGLLASPLFTGVLATELVKDEKAKAHNLPANLLGGSIGFLIFFAVGNTGLEDYLELAAGPPLVPLDIVLASAFGIVGVVMAVTSGVLVKVADAVFSRLKDRPIQRALLAGLVFSAVGMVAPILMFSGETQVKEITANAASYGSLELVGMALAKLALLAVALRSGFLGGPTFPAIFASVCVGIAINQLLPWVPLEVAIGGTMAGFLVVFFRAPFMVILLTSLMLAPDPEVVALVIISVASAMIVQPYVVSAVQARAAARMARRRGTGAAG
jgi:H+/Cl- antiporter ClcA